MVGFGSVPMVVRTATIDMPFSPGYVLKSQMKALSEEVSEKLSIEEEIENQRPKVKTLTPVTPELFLLWKEKIEERDANLAAEQADRAKNDRMSGRELFLSDATLFVGDAEAYDNYQTEPESDDNEQGSPTAAFHVLWPMNIIVPYRYIDYACHFTNYWVQLLVDGNAAKDGPSTSAARGNAEVPDDDDDELDMDELNELEASLSKASIQTKEPGTET